MEFQHRRLIGIAMCHALSLACGHSVFFMDGEEESESSSREEPAGTLDMDDMDDSKQPEILIESDPLLPSADDAPPAPPSTSPDDDGDSSDGSSQTPPASGSDAGEVMPAESTPPGDAASTEPPLPLPDLVLDGEYLAATIQQAVVDASADQCLIDERCITGTGVRRVVRFGTRSGNIGTADLVAGRPTLENPTWEYDACHDHFHFEGYAQYDLIDALSNQVLPIGVKHGFCLRDLGSWDGSVPADRCAAYDCDYQGLGVGCYDVYVPELDCQWVDITDVAPGEYVLRVTINSEQRIAELDRSNNSASVRILITPDTVQPLP